MTAIKSERANTFHVLEKAKRKYNGTYLKQDIHRVSRFRFALSFLE